LTFTKQLIMSLDMRYREYIKVCLIVGK